MFCMEIAIRCHQTFSQPGSPIILVIDLGYRYTGLFQANPLADSVKDTACKKKIAIFCQYLAISWKRYKIGPWLQWNVNSN